MNQITTAHFIYFGEGGLPVPYQKSLNSFYEKHKTWKIKLWTLPDINRVIAGSEYLFSDCTTFINKYNFIKYHILSLEGGWYVDLDIDWRLSLDNLIFDKVRTSNFPDMILPVRSLPWETEVNYKSLDDMLVFSKAGVFSDLLKYISNRTDIDIEKPFEPYGPVSLSKWVSDTNYNVVYMYEKEIQKNGYYCNHQNANLWLNK